MGIHEEYKEKSIFPIGEVNEAFADVFIGTSYLENLVSDPEIPVGVGHVTFEPACRNDWHIHRDGYQILLVTQGEGWYQEEGKGARALKAGDVVITHQDVKHWHGAKKDQAFSHIAITAGTLEWLEPVSDDHYETLG